MKTSLFTLALLVSFAVYGGEGNGPENQPPAYSIAERGPHHRTWQKVVSSTNGLGQAIIRTNHAYTELATGMHFQRNGQWIESQTTVEGFPGGAAATNGQHQAYFPANIYNGVIELVTPDGQHLKSRPLGLSYFDGSNSVLIAELTNSSGQILPSGNQVIYTNAFTDFSADLVCTYRKSGFECDVVFRQRPPTPGDFEINSQNCRLQLLTEFFDTPEPAQVHSTTNQNSGLIDTTLQFGTMKMARGRAFLIGDFDPQPGRGIAVYKSWAHLNGRTLLIEEVSYPQIASQLEELQAFNRSSFLIAANSARRKVSASPLLPPARMVQRGTNMMQLAKANLNQKPGLVLDYFVVSEVTNDFTFQSDTTYFVSGQNSFGGTTTIEGGAVVKFGEGDPNIDLSGPVVCSTSAYRPGLFTSQHDDSVGGTIAGSSGIPPVQEYAYNLMLDSSSITSVSNLHFRYLYAGLTPFSTTVLHVWDCQFFKCEASIDDFTGNDIYLHNVLFSECKAAVALEEAGSSVIAEHVTADVTNFWSTNAVAPDALLLTNSILIGNIKSGPTLSTNFVAINPGGTIFQASGGGGYYLANESRFRNVGTTNITSGLLAGLQSKTTYPPILYNVLGASFTNWLDLFPQAQRDTDIPDLGYHYDPLDYVVGAMFVTNATVVIQPGTAVGMYGTNGFSYGIGIGFDARFFCRGTADHLTRIVEYNTVQEQTPLDWDIPSYGLIAAAWDRSYVDTCRFIDWSVMAQDAAHIQITDDIGPVNFQDCQFHGGQLLTSRPTYNLTNCLFERVTVDLALFDDLTPVIRNNLFLGGTFRFVPTVSDSIIRDNLFDQTTIPNSIIDEGSGAYDGGFNAFVTNRNRLQPTNANDVILIASPGYQIGPLGKFYYPTNLSALINAGSTNATFTGLYHFTTTTNQVKETNSVVDIGFHYTSIGQISTISPADDDDDGVPDYLEDYNGNGAVNSGETDWRNATDSGLKVWITRPRGNSTIP